ncbi:TPA: KxYKxGKxW signal peptide domain-containing protein, partial [Staphylococcus delphini]|nr:KxYKxGKxW signal peptide domain-containing protein [Staphylococcus delphini]
MTKKQKRLKKSLSEEKARVRLYKSGKNWVKAGIREFEILRIMGMPFIGNEIKETEKMQNKTLSKNMLKATTVLGGTFVTTALNTQEAFAASELPSTSELSTQSETVGNQNSTTIYSSENATTSESADENVT